MEKYKDKNWLYSQYITDQLTMREIADSIQCGSTTILQWLRKFDIPRRKLGGKVNDLQGKKFGRLTVIADTGKKAHGHIRWGCRCECGKLTETLGISLKNGDARSCGCLRKECTATMGRLSYKHGETGSRLYKIHRDMKNRCHNPDATGYKYYGGKGIRVCDEWFNSYLTFRDFALLDGYKENLVIHRLNSKQGYYPGNCHFITKAENCAKGNK